MSTDRPLSLGDLLGYCAFCSEPCTGAYCSQQCRLDFAARLGERGAVPWWAVVVTEGA